jgi:hypothetical protein
MTIVEHVPTTNPAAETVIYSPEESEQLKPAPVASEEAENRVQRESSSKTR